MIEFERRREPLAPPRVFARRVAIAAALGMAFIAVSLVIGMWGFMAFEGLDFLDAFLNASMLLSGMGPLHNPATTGGKVFAGLYAIFCGFAVLGTAAFIFAPMWHRLMHRFHLESAKKNDDP